MSWGITLIGNPEKISAELDAYEATLTGASLEEFKEAKPALQQLVKLNLNQSSITRLEASGHATFTELPGEPRRKTNGYCAIQIQQWHGKLAV